MTVATYPGNAAGLIVHSRHPYNAEPPLDRLCANLLTQSADFYIRCHGNIAHLNESAHRLRVAGKVTSPLDLSMNVLRSSFVQRSVTATLQCAGNRRGELHQVKPVTGDPWAPGAIGNARWTGVALSDILRAAGAVSNPAHHVVFTACDDCTVDDESFPYAVSISMTKAMSPEVLLACEANGEPLAPEHGFPLRAVIPGFAGARSAKWLTSIEVQDHPSDAKPQARDYKAFSA